MSIIHQMVKVEKIQRIENQADIKHNPEKNDSQQKTRKSVR